MTPLLPTENLPGDHHRANNTSSQIIRVEIHLLISSLLSLPCLSIWLQTELVFSSQPAKPRFFFRANSILLQCAQGFHDSQPYSVPQTSNLIMARARATPSLPTWQFSCGYLHRLPAVCVSQSLAPRHTCEWERSYIIQLSNPQVSSSDKRK